MFVSLLDARKLFPKHHQDSNHPNKSTKNNLQYSPISTKNDSKLNYHADAEGDTKWYPEDSKEEEAVHVGLGELVLPIEGHGRLVGPSHCASHPQYEARVDENREEHGHTDDDGGAHDAGRVDRDGKGFAPVDVAEIRSEVQGGLQSDGRRGDQPDGQDGPGHATRRQHVVSRENGMTDGRVCVNEVANASGQG